MLGSVKIVSANSFALGDRRILGKGQTKYFGEKNISTVILFRPEFLLRHASLKSWLTFSWWMSCWCKCLCFHTIAQLLFLKNHGEAQETP